MDDIINLDSSVEESPLRRGLLSSIDAVFEQNRRENERRISKLRDHREAELAHSSYLKQNAAPQDLKEAKFVVQEWANKHSSQKMNRITHEVNQRRQNKETIPVISRTNSRLGPVKYLTQNNSSGIGKVKTSVMDKRRHKSSPYTREHPTGRRNQSSSPRPKLKHITTRSPERGRTATSTVTQQNAKKTTSPQTEQSDSVLELSDNENSIIDITDSDISCLAETGPLFEFGRIERPRSPEGDVIISTVEKARQVRCPVLNCNFKSTTKLAFDRHMEKFEHSPNTPWFDFTEEEQSAADSERVMCPECSKTFKCHQHGLQHIQDSKHVYPLPPLPLMGFLCVQCLSVFSTQDSCMDHIKELKHTKAAFPFADIKEHDYQKGIPISKKFLSDYNKLCLAADFNVLCCDCELPIRGPRELKQHLDETRLTHHCMALTEVSKFEIFASYFCTHKCATCHAAVLNPKQNGGFHNCNEKIAGKVITNGIKTFQTMVIGHCVRLEQSEVKELKVEVKAKNTKVINDFKFEVNPKSSEVKNRNRVEKMDWETSEPSTSTSSLPISRFPEVKTSQFKESSKTEVRPVVKSPENNKITNLPVVKSPKLAPSQPQPSYLKTMDNIIFLDVDNWGNFFQKLPNRLPEKTFVWAFYGGNTFWKRPTQCNTFEYQVREKRFHLHDKCGRTKDAADFAICLTVGKLDMCLPETVHFTILSGDKGFCEIERQMKSSKRNAVVIDPHQAVKMSNEVLYAMIVSVGQT